MYTSSSATAALCEHEYRTCVYCCNNSYPVLDRACFATIAGTKALAGAATTATKAAATVVAFMMLACRGTGEALSNYLRRAVSARKIGGEKALVARVADAGCDNRLFRLKNHDPHMFLRIASKRFPNAVSLPSKQVSLV